MTISAQLPDGTELQFPDGTRDEVIDSVVKQHLGGGADKNLGGTLQLGNPFGSGRLDTGIPLPASVEAALVGAGKTATRIGQGIRQLLPGDNAQLDQQVAQENAAYKPLAGAHPLATGVGEALPAMAIPVGAAASVPAALVRAAGANMLPGMLEYGTAQERAQRGAIGAAGGAAGGALGYGVGRLLNPVRGANPLATDETRALANQAGITLTPAQATGSKVLSSLDGTLATLPGSAGVMAKIQQGQRSGFNNAAMAVMGQPPMPSIANDAASLVKQGIGNQIEQAAAGVRIPVDMPLLNDLASVESKYAKNLTPDQRPIVGQYINDILGQGDSFDGAAYQTWRSRIGARANSTQDSELKGALKGLQGALDSAFDRAAPQAQSAAMQAARGQYRNFKTLQPLIEKAAMSSSNIPPAQVMSRALATKNNTPAMQNLAQLGQTIGNEYPNSGTAPRLFWMSMLRNPLGALAVAPMAAASWTAARAIHNPLSRAYLTNELMTPELERLLIRSGGLLGAGVGVPATRGLLGP